MITLIHGDDQTASRKRLQEEKDRLENTEIISLDGAQLQLSDLILACQTNSFFSSQKLLIIENLFTGKLDKQKQLIYNYLAHGDYQVKVILWEGKEIEKTVIKKYFTHTREILCQPSKLLFRFLESIGNQSNSQLITSFHTILDQDDPEFIFAMILRQWRQLLIVKEGKESIIDQIPSWQRQRLEKQAGYFSLSALINLYKQLIIIDYKIKTGLTPLTKVALLDIFLLSL